MLEEKDPQFEELKKLIVSQQLKNYLIQELLKVCLQKDNLTDTETISSFAAQTKATLTVMTNGEHWFHTAEQMAFLDSWLKRYS